MRHFLKLYNIATSNISKETFEERYHGLSLVMEPNLAVQRSLACHGPLLSHLPLVKLLWSCRAQTDKAIVLSDGPRTFPGRGKALHFCHQVQALLGITKVASLGRGFLV